MKVSVTLTFTDDAGNVVEILMGKPVKLEVGHQLAAIEESFADAALKQQQSLEAGRRAAREYALAHHD